MDLAPHVHKQHGKVAGAWAIFVMHYNSITGETQTIGYIVGPTTTEHDSLYYLGASKDGSETAELYAIVWLQQYLIKHIKR